MAGEVTAGLADSNGSLPTVYDFGHLRSDAEDRDQLRNPTQATLVSSTRLLYHFTADEMLCILCCRLSADRGVVYKVAQWRSGSGRIHFVTVAVLRPFRYAVRPIWQMILRTTSNDKVRVYANSTSNRISHRAISLLCPAPIGRRHLAMMRV